MDNPVLTPERLAAAQDAARQKLLRRTKVAGKPAAPPPPRPPTLKERMRGGGIVPLDELLAHQDEIIAATEREREQIVRRSQREREAYEASRAAFAQQKPAFDELCTIQVQLAQALARRRREAGETQQLLEDQVQLRCRSIAEAIGASSRYVEEASRVVAAADGGKHFGNLSYVLDAAVRYGFWEQLDKQRYQRLHVHDKQRAIPNRGQHYLPADRLSVLDELVSTSIRALFKRAIEAAEAERPLQFAMLESGPFPTVYELYDLADPEKPLAADRQFGCVLVQVPMPRGGGNPAIASGVIQLAFVNVEGSGKCVAVLAVNGSAARTLPNQVTVPFTNLSGSPAVAAVVRHLSDIASEALLTDEQAAQINEVRTRKQRPLIPAAAEDRQVHFLELAGELWRDRNAGWIARQRPQAAPAAAGSEAATTTATTGEPAAKPKGKTKVGGNKRAKAGGNGVSKGTASAGGATKKARSPARTGDPSAS
ncbi:hypothetical protein HY635_03760 [Candidatus Uhrbacteria bacterium]|nr:hypothetical protein [Candidatus Uhrbacteria bacterium]